MSVSHATKYKTYVIGRKLTLGNNQSIGCFCDSLYPQDPICQYLFDARQWATQLATHKSAFIWQIIYDAETPELTLVDMTVGEVQDFRWSLSRCRCWCLLNKQVITSYISKHCRRKRTMVNQRCLKTWCFSQKKTWCYSLKNWTEHIDK